MPCTSCLTLVKSTWHLGPLLRVNRLGTYSRNMRESQRVKGLRSKLSAKEKFGPHVNSSDVRLVRRLLKTIR